MTVAAAGLDKGGPIHLFSSCLRLTLFSLRFLCCLSLFQVRMQEPASLIELSSALGLDSTSIGDAHCVVAEEIAKRLAEVPMDEQEDAWEQKMINKLLFLSNRHVPPMNPFASPPPFCRVHACMTHATVPADLAHSSTFLLCPCRVFTQLDEEETREYELSRLEEILGLSTSEGSDRIQGLVLPFYAGIVRSGIEHIRSGKGQALDADKLAAWRKSLGIKDAVAAKLHSEAFSSEVTKAVEAGKGRLREESMNFLERVRSRASESEWGTEGSEGDAAERQRHEGRVNNGCRFVMRSPGHSRLLHLS